MPGFVNMHSHLGMTYLRGFADDLSLADWLTQHIWPAEGVFVSPSFVKHGTELGLVEMIRCGTTCANDMCAESESDGSWKMIPTLEFIYMLNSTSSADITGFITIDVNSFVSLCFVLNL